MINAYHEPLDFEIQESPAGGWRRAIDTGLDSPLDIADPGRNLRWRLSRYRVLPRSVVVLLGGDGRVILGRSRQVCVRFGTTTRSQSEEITIMTIGYDRPLYILPFDHRGTFQKNMFGWTGTLTPSRRRRSPP